MSNPSDTYECEFCGKRFTNFKESKEHEKTDCLTKELKLTGSILIALGILHIIFSGFLDLTWGLVLIPIGIISFFYHSRKMLLVFGILLILVGILNFFTSVNNSLYDSNSTDGFWNILAFFQIYWGIKEIIRFKRTKERKENLFKENRKKGFIWYSLRISFIALIVFWISSYTFAEPSFYFSILVFVVTLFILIISIINLCIYQKKNFAVLSLGVSTIFMLLMCYGAYDALTAPTTSNGTLQGGYAAYYPFNYQTITEEVTFEFNSSSPITAYFVMSEKDYDNFMQNLNYNSYPCAFYSEKNIRISCNVSSGGIIVWNPGSQLAEYTISSI